MSRLSQHELQVAATRMNNWMDSHKAGFVGRDRTIDLLRLALVTRQHLLLYGPPGTAKTAVCDRVFGSIERANGFRIELSMFMDDTALFGPYDVKKMREEGVLEHVTTNMLPEAHVARIGEMLDGSLATLRSLLGALNERHIRRGRQVMDIPLISCYADTNVDPREYMERHPNVWAVLDRMLFQHKVDYLQTEEDVTEMIRRFQTGQTTQSQITIPLDLIHSISELVVLPPDLIREELLFQVIGKATFEYRRRRQELIKSGDLKDHVLPIISDRRFALVSQLAEASAVLSGRIEVQPEDIRQMHFGLGTTERERDLWLEIVDQQIQWYRQERSRQLDQAQLGTIVGIGREVEILESALSSVAQDTDTLREHVETLKILKRRLEDMVPDNDTVANERQKVQHKLDQVREDLSSKILEEAGLTETA